MKYRYKILCCCLLTTYLGTNAFADQTADKINQYLERKYYRIEFILFERNPHSVMVAGEDLGFDLPEPWPVTMITMPADDEALAAAYPLDLLSRFQLDWPTIEITVEESDEVADLESVDSAESFPEEEGEIAEELPAEIAPLSTEEELPEVDLEQEFLATMQDYEQSLLGMSFQMFDQLQLTGQARKVSRRHRIIFHGAWQQPIQPRNQPMGIMFQPEAGLEGVFGVTLGRYLHFKVDLWKRFKPYTPIEVQPINTPINPHQPTALALPEIPISEDRYLHFKESRRMRSEELHYLDHPRFGLLVRIDPIEPPPEVVLQFQALEESKKSE